MGWRLDPVTPSSGSGSLQDYRRNTSGGGASPSGFDSSAVMTREVGGEEVVSPSQDAAHPWDMSEGGGMDIMDVQGLGGTQGQDGYDSFQQEQAQQQQHQQLQGQDQAQLLQQLLRLPRHEQQAALQQLERLRDQRQAVQQEGGGPLTSSPLAQQRPHQQEASLSSLLQLLTSDSLPISLQSLLGGGGSNQPPPTQLQGTGGKPTTEFPPPRPPQAFPGSPGSTLRPAQGGNGLGAGSGTLAVGHAAAGPTATGVGEMGSPGVAGQQADSALPLSSPRSTADAIVARLSPDERVHLLTQLLSQSGGTTAAAMPGPSAMSLPAAAMQPSGAETLQGATPLLGSGSTVPGGQPMSVVQQLQERQQQQRRRLPATHSPGLDGSSSPVPASMPAHQQAGIVAALQALLLPGAQQEGGQGQQVRPLGSGAFLEDPLNSLEMQILLPP